MPTRRVLLQGLGAGALLLIQPSRRRPQALGTLPDDLALRPASELAARIRRREISCVALLEHYLQRIERFNPALNAVVWLDPERAPGSGPGPPTGHWPRVAPGVRCTACR